MVLVPFISRNDPIATIGCDRRASCSSLTLTESLSSTAAVRVSGLGALPDNESTLQQPQQVAIGGLLRACGFLPVDLGSLALAARQSPAPVACTSRLHQSQDPPTRVVVTLDLWKRVRCRK
jgi:hypothetical protein